MVKRLPRTLFFLARPFRGTAWILLLAASNCAQLIGVDNITFSDAGGSTAGFATALGGRAADDALGGVGGRGGELGGDGELGGGGEVDSGGEVGSGGEGGGGGSSTADCTPGPLLSCASSQACSEQPCGGFLWQGGEVPFRINANVPRALVERMLRVADAWSLNPVVRFSQCPGDDCSGRERWLEVAFASEVSLSPASPSGAQVLSLPAAVTNERIAHELGHVLGLPDLWRRPDRDRYVRLHESAVCGPQAHAEFSKCTLGPFDGNTQPTRRSTGYFGPMDFKSAMNLSGSDVCEGEELDPARALPTAADSSALIELYQTLLGFSPFAPLGRDVGAQKPLQYSLAEHVFVAGNPALSSLLLSQTMVYVLGSDKSIYIKAQWGNAELYGEWGEWTSLGCCFNSDPAATAWSSLRADLFARDETGAIRWLTLAGNDPPTWSESRSIGSPAVGAASGPAVASFARGRLDVFVRGGDDYLYWTRFEASTWSAWVKLGNRPFSGTPAVASMRDGRLDVVLADQSGELMQLSFDGWWPNDFRRLDGESEIEIGTSPALAASAGKLYLYAHAANSHHLIERRSDGSKWNEWRDRGGLLRGSPAAVGSTSRPHVDVAAQVVAGAEVGVWLRSWPYERPCFVPGKTCGECAEACNGECPFVGAPVGTPSFHVDRQGEDVWTFRATDNHIYRLNDARKLDFLDLSRVVAASGLAQSDPLTYSRTEGIDSVVYQALDGESWEVYRENNAWRAGSLAQYTNGPDSAGEVSPYVRGDGYNSMVYRGNDQHIYETYLVKGVWYTSDLSTLANSPAANGNPKPFVRADNDNAVIYRGLDNRLYELSLEAGSAWVFRSIAPFQDAPEASLDAHPYVRSDNRNAIVYRAGAGEIVELSAAADSHAFIASNLSAAASAPDAAGAPRGYIRADDVDAVVYTATDGSIFELTRRGQRWTSLNLSQSAGAPLAAGEPVPYVRADDTSAVAYVGADNRLYELELHGESWRVRTLFSAP